MIEVIETFERMTEYEKVERELLQEANVPYFDSQAVAWITEIPEEWEHCGVGSADDPGLYKHTEACKCHPNHPPTTSYVLIAPTDTPGEIAAYDVTEYLIEYYEWDRP